MIDLREKLSGRFIVVDGPDGAGKSTQLDLLADFLTESRVDLVRARDPGGTAIGDRIREILLSPQHAEMAPATELLLYMASRAQLVEQSLRPALAAGKCVLCDRYVWSTVAYQGAAGCDIEAILQVAQVAVGGLWPDLTIILDIDSQQGLSRLKRAPDRMEAKAIEFHQKVRDLYLQQARSHPDKIVVVNAAGGIQAIHRQIRQIIETRRFRESTE
jgi:dTMP kinase